MALPGQASGDFTESSSALRILYVGTRNSYAAQLTTDGFIQTNPPVITAAAAVSSTLPTAPKRGVLGGSVAFTRPDAGNGWVGGPTGASVSEGPVRPLGVFINDADGNAYENTPAPASGQAPYLSGQGTYGTRLYETQVIAGTPTSGAQGDDLTYQVGGYLYASINGYLTSALSGTGTEDADVHEVAAGDSTDKGDSTVIGVVKIVPDSVHAELVYDQRI